MILPATMRKLQEKDASIYRLDYGPRAIGLIDGKEIIIDGGYELFVTKTGAIGASGHHPSMIAIVETPARNYCHIPEADDTDREAFQDEYSVIPRYAP